MKSLDLNACGVSELNEMEMTSFEGGSDTIGKIIVIIAFLLGCLA
jgi:hypothetical protein